MAVTQTTDTPSTNFCTFNPLNKGSGATFQNGNTKVSLDNNCLAQAGMPIPTSGKYYFECLCVSGFNNQVQMIGVMPITSSSGSIDHDQVNAGSTPTLGVFINVRDGDKIIDSAFPGASYGSAIGGISYGSGASSPNRTVQVAIDADNGTIWFGDNNTWFNSATAGEIAAGTTTNSAETGRDYSVAHFPTVACTSTTSPVFDFNFGATDFAYTPPTGYKALSAANEASNVTLTIQDGSLYFQNARWNGTNKAGLVVNTAETLIHMTADSSGSGIHSNDVDSLAVLFQPKKTGPITRAGFQALNTSGAANSGNFVNAIYEIQGGTASAPDGSNLTNGQVTGITGNDGDYIYATFPNGGPIVEAGKNYWLKLSHSSGSWACTHDVAGDDLVLGQGNSLLQGSTLQTTRSTNHQIYQGPGTLADGTASKEYPASTFAPDWVWMANRDDDGDSRPMYDTVRGVTKRIKSDADSQQDTDSTGLTAFSTTGFTISTRNSINNIKKGHIGWMWAAGGAPTTDNVSDSGSPGQTPTDGSVFRDGAASTTAFGSAGIYPTRASINTTAGLSILTYTGTGSATTVAHGLGAIPKVIMVKKLNADVFWAVYHESNTDAPATEYLRLNTNDPTADDAGYWNDVQPDANVFTINNESSVNTGGGTPGTYVAYVWTEIPGFSKFGKYLGNDTGSNHFGPVVHTGFKPAWVMIKRSDGTEGWYIRDTARNQDATGPSADKDFAEGAPGNPTNPPLIQIDSTNNEDPGWSGNSPCDFLSNGFVVQRGSSGAFNVHNGNWVWMAFAEHPFAGSTPATAC